MATTVTQWTVADLAEYCEMCTVIAVQENEKYCLGCLNEITCDLAIQFDEQNAVDRGLY